MSGIHVRPSRREDLPAMWRLVEALADYERLRQVVSGSARMLEDALFGPRALLHGWVAEQDGELVGYALVYETFSSFRCTRGLWLEDLFVIPTARGSGAGRALMKAVAREGLARGCDRIQWHVLDWNQLAIDFYRARGAGAVQADWLTYGLDGAALAELARD